MSIALLYATIGAIVAYAINGLVVGWGPLFVVPSVTALHSMYGYAGMRCRPCGRSARTALPVVFYRTRDLFRALPIPVWLKPAIGDS